MDEQKSVFRKKSLERISSPDRLNNYIKVANPGIWAILAGVIIFLAGICAWGLFGKLDSVIKAPVIVSQGSPFLFISEMNIDDISSGTEVVFADTKTKVTDISSQPVQASSVGNDYFLHTGSFSGSEWIYICSLEGDAGGISDGVYESRVIIGSTSPMSFVTN